MDVQEALALQARHEPFGIRIMNAASTRQWTEDTACTGAGAFGWKGGQLRIMRPWGLGVPYKL